MSKIDQAFVKAFARRQTADVNLASEDVNIPEDGIPASRLGTPPELRQQTLLRARSAGTSLRIDRSVADTTAVWVDPVEDQMIRSDRGHQDAIPRPRILDRVQAESNEEVTGSQETTDSDSEQPLEDYAIASFTTDVYSDSGSIGQALLGSLSSPLSTLPEPPSVQDRNATSPVDAASPVDVANAAEQDQVSGSRLSTVFQLADQNNPSPKQDDVVTNDVSIETEQPSIDATDVEAPMEEEFQAAWEVDALDIPATVSGLFLEDQVFEFVGQRIEAVVRDGMQTALVTSERASEGRSTVALGVALAAAAAGIRVLLVDADFANPTLAESLRLDVEADWAGALRSGESIDNAAIFAGQDLVTLMPLREPSSTPGGIRRVETANLQALLEEVKPHFDLVIVDAGYGDAVLRQMPRKMDAALIVRDMRTSNASSVNIFARNLSRAGAHTVGVIENFVASPTKISA